MAEGIRLLVTLDDKGTPQVAKVKAGLKGLGDEAEKQGRRWNKTWKGMGEGVTQVSGAVKKFAPIAAIGAAAVSGIFVAGLKSGVQFNASLETIKTQYRVIIGDATKANKLFQETLQFSARTPFQMEEVARARKMLIAFGMSSLEALTLTGDAAAAAGISLEDMALVLGRIKSGAFGEAFMRLAETGIATREMLEGQGLEFDKGGAYKGSADEAMAAVQNIIRTRFGGMMDEQSRTFEGSVSTMKDNWNILKGKISEPLFEKLKPKVLEITALFQQWMEAPKLDQLAQGVADVFDKMLAGGKVAIEVAAGIWDIKEGIGAATAVLVGLTAAQWAFNAAASINPWAIAIVSVAALVGWFVHIEAKYKSLSIWFAYMKGGFLQFVESIKWAGAVIRDFGIVVWEAIKASGLTVKDFFSVMQESARESAKNVGAIFSHLGDAIAAAFTFRFDDMKASLATMGDIVVNDFSAMIDRLAVAGDSRFAKVGEAWGNLQATAQGEAYMARWQGYFDEYEQTVARLQGSGSGAGDTGGGLPPIGGGAGAVDAPISTGRVDGGGSIIGAGFGLGEQMSAYQEHMDNMAAVSLAENEYERVLAEQYKEMWGEAYMDVATIQQQAYGLMEENTTALFESMFDSQKNGIEKWQDFFSGIKSDLIKASTQMASRWIFDQVRMALVKNTTEVKVTAAALAGAQARIGAAVTEAAATNIEQSSDQVSAVTKVFKAHAGIPFAGVGIASGMVGAMLATIQASRALRTGGLIDGIGSGNEDTTVARVSPNEFVQPSSAVNRYGVDFMESVRVGSFQPQGGDLNVQFNLQGGGNYDLREAIEDEIVPILERLSGQRRFTLAVT